MQATDFVEQHKKHYVNYCEVLILPDGDVQYAIPSHLYKLYMFYGLTEQDFQEQTEKYSSFISTIPLTASPVSWMCQDKNIVSVWYNFCIIPIDYTYEQMLSMKLLIDSGCVSSECTFDCSIEKFLTTDSDKLSVEKLDDLIAFRQERLMEFEKFISKRLVS